MPKRGDTQEKQEIDRTRCLQMLNDGYTPLEIKKKLKRSLSFISKTKNSRKMYKVKTKSRTGRPKVLTSLAKRLIRNSRCKRKGSTRKLAKQLKQEENLKVGHVTIWRFQKEEGQKPYKRPKEPLLSSKNIRSRKMFADKYVKKPQKFWDDWLWTDEKYFGLSEKSNTKNDVACAKTKI
jgi:transposase